MTYWHPINTAPKDGTRILYCCKDGMIGHCRWDEGMNEDEYPCWWDREHDDEVCPHFWAQALPLPPQTSG